MSAAQTLLIASYALVASSESETAFTLTTSAIYFNYGACVGQSAATDPSPWIVAAYPSLPPPSLSPLGGNFAMYPFVTAELFGADRSGVNYGAVFMVYGLTSATCVLVLTLFLASGTDALVYCLGAIQAVGTLLAVALGRLSAALPLDQHATSPSVATKSPLADDSALAPGLAGNDDDGGGDEEQFQ